MAPQLFSADLGTIQFNDLEEFLGLNRPLDQRIPEGSRIDYKLQQPDDLGDCVAAMANAYGGLIFLGIKSDKTKKNVPIEWNGVNLGPDPTARIASHILATVHPAPMFQIGIVSVGSSHVVVIRVDEGDYPPYEYAKGNLSRISIRSNDVTRPAMLREIEAMLQRRNGVSHVVDQTTGELDLPSFFPYRQQGEAIGAGQIRESAHTITLAPHRLIPIRTDRRFARLFEGWLRDSFPDFTSPAYNYSRRGFLEVREIHNASPRVHRAWRISRSGALGFTRNADRHGSPGEPVSDLAADLLFFFRLASRHLRDAAAYGMATVCDQMQRPSTTLLPKFPEPNGGSDFDTVSCIRFPQDPAAIVPRPATSAWLIDAAFDAIEAGIDVTTSILFEQLRELWGANIDYDEFRATIAALDNQSRSNRRDNP